MSTSTTTPRARRLLAVGTGVVTLGLIMTACTGGDFGPVGGADPGPGPAGTDRRAGSITRGAAVCVFNGSDDDFSVQITQSEDNQDGYRNTSGTETFAAHSWRCMKSDSYTAAGTARMRITIASGEQFRVEGFNPPWDPPWIAVNGDSRSREVGETTHFKIGKHPIVAERIDDTGDYVRFDVRIS